MDESIIIGLVQNIAILLAFSMLYDYFWSRNEKLNNIYFRIGSGAVLGAIGIVLILTPWHFVPGIFFDTRSVMLSVAGLFFGPVPTITAMIITVLYRIFMGGAGTIMGIAVAITSGTVGLLWWHFRPEWRKKKPLIELGAMGILVHLIMLSCTIFLPDEVRWQTLKSIALPAIFIYPVATALLGMLMLNQAENWENRKSVNISEERWHFALEGSGDGVWDWNLKTNEIFFSKQWKLMLGYEDNEIDCKLEEWDKRVFPEDKEMVYKILNQHINGETPVYISEHRLLCKDGTYKWILDRGKIMTFDTDGKPLRFIGIHTDISERKEAQEEIRKMNEVLEQKVLERTNELEKRGHELLENEAALMNIVEDLNMKSAELRQSTEQLQAANKELEAFSYSVSHDLRAPLRAISGFVSILMEDYGKDLDSEGKRICNIIHSNATKMGQLIDDLLSFSRLIRSEIHQSKIDMENMVKIVISEFQSTQALSQESFSIQQIPGASGDSNLIKQVWVNLISNAIKYSSKEVNAQIDIGAIQNNNETVYYIKDNGVGFNMQYSNKLFGVFQRLHGINEFEGTGVGLAIVQRIINRHGGRVWAEGEVGKGATFFFTLPLN
ncbi:MAG: PAS domain-containing protein [Prolixibacteraceae bacterium]|nr:PAS domain-containing protein [Prolixibacteraceae bacterium]